MTTPVVQKPQTRTLRLQLFLKRLSRFQSHIPKELLVCHFLHWKEENKVFEDVDHQVLYNFYSFPEVSEQLRLNCLLKSLQVHHYNVKLVDSTKTLHHYCQFSGGGDLCVTKDVKPPLVIVSPTDEVDTTTALDQGTSGGDMPSSSTSGGDMPSSKLSPLTNGDSKLASLCIESYGPT